MKNFRSPSQKENAILDILASHEFLGHIEIKNQLNNCKVRTIDKDGSIEIKINADKKRANVKERVPVEAKLETNTYPICFLLHVIDGYAVELEVYKADLSGYDHINKIDNLSQLRVFA
jgi:hypothetical protein